MKSIFLLLITVTFYFFSHAQTDSANYKDALRMIDIWLDAKKDYDKLPGISVAIVDDQNLLFSKGYGYADVEKKIPMQAETICSICSISKLFTSVAVMQLWEEGKLRLDDSLAAILHSFNLKQQYSESVPVTIRSLLTHSSGLPREAAFAYWSAPDFNFPTEKELNEKLIQQQTLYPSSTYFQYSNLGMSLLGQVVSKTTGEDYNEYVERKILQPLQLTNTHPYLPKNLWRTKMATGYSALHRDGSRKMMHLFQAKGVTAAAGFSSNVVDLARFASWQFRLLKGNTKEILRPSTLKEMQRVQWMDPDGKTLWGLGFVVSQFNGVTYVGHSGSCPGYRTLLMLNPKSKKAVSIMINAQGVRPQIYAGTIFEILTKVETDKKDTTTLNVDLNEYAGTYDQSTWGGDLAILPWKGKLAIISLDEDSPLTGMSVYRYIGKDKFRRIRTDDGSLGEEIYFERDANGKVVKMWNPVNSVNKLK